jgi:hypothetical protein
VCKIFGSSFKLRIAQAYMKLMTIPESEHGIRKVSLASIGNHEILMFDELEGSIADTPVFWLELCDRDGQSIDSCCCEGIEPAMAALENFAAQVNGANEICSGNGRDSSS